MIKLTINGIQIEVETPEEANQLINATNISVPTDRNPRNISASYGDADVEICVELMDFIQALNRPLIKPEREIIVRKQLKKLTSKHPGSVSLRVYQWHRLLSGDRAGKNRGEVAITPRVCRDVMNYLEHYHPAQLQHVRSILK